MKNEIEELKKQVSLLQIASAKVTFKKQGEEYWACCPFHNENTPSFAIKVKNGEEIFFCQGCGKGGDVIRFIEFLDHCTTKQAIEKLKGISGNVDYVKGAQKVGETFRSVADEKKKITFPISTWPPLENALKNNAAAIAYLKNERGVSIETAIALRLGYSQSCKGFLQPQDEEVRDKGWLLFPRIVDDKIVAVKMRSIVHKAFSQWKDMDAKALFNSETINSLEPVFVTEGEFDSAIFEQAGFRAVSIPNANTKLTPESKVLLKQAACVYLAGDNDGTVGNIAMRQLQRELGDNTYMLLWPGAKDSNAFFKDKCNCDVDLFQQQVQTLVDRARNTPVEGFTSLVQRLRNTGGTDLKNDPLRLHFFNQQLDDMNYNPAGSVVVIYSTYSSTGKTVFTTQLMLHEAKRGEIVVVYSPELRDEMYLALVASQTVGSFRLPEGLDRKGKITQRDYEECAQLLDKPTERNTDFRFYVGHSLPETETDKIVDFIEMTIKVTGATRFVIDTIHRIVQNNGRESITEAEGRIVKRLEALGIKYGTIFVLIGQSNKEASGLKESNRDEHGILRGSKELTDDVPFGVYLMHRKRNPVREGNDPDEILALETDIILKKDRGRGPGKPVVHLLYKKECSKFFLLDKGTSVYNDKKSEDKPK